MSIASMIRVDWENEDTQRAIPATGIEDTEPAIDAEPAIVHSRRLATECEWPPLPPRPARPMRHAAIHRVVTRPITAV
jgi:hypothetical protein